MESASASSVRELADIFHERWLETYPFTASMYGISTYDARVPDESEEGEARWRGELESFLGEARGFDPSQLSQADAVTLGCLVENINEELIELDARLLEHTVSAMPITGAPVLLAIAARTIIADAQAAADYLERLRGSGVWLDQQTERLRIGAAKGRLPVAPLVQEAIEWAETVLRAPVPEALAAPQPPDGWAGEVAWREELDAVGAQVIKPALIRWIELLRELLPRSRPGEQAGLVYLPGGAADYANCVRAFTTLPLTAEEIHRIGLEELEALEQTMLKLGAELRLGSLAEIQEAARASSARRSPADAMAAATAAIRRAEASSPGTFWFNLERPTAGTGWDLEVVAFHEGVPGHHLQLSRIRMLDDLPAMQRQRALSVYSEGWALYAERLADEMGLYSDAESRIGELATSIMRAARLVVDTGLHALGWSRQRALDFYLAHVQMPEAFLANEIDRYIVVPGQALTYTIGQRELLRLRGEAERRLGSRFALPEFHAAVLDSGSLPMPVLEEKIRAWAGSS
jgi:uncharacterized protein (DUF885 family)